MTVSCSVQLVDFLSGAAAAEANCIPLADIPESAGHSVVASAELLRQQAEYGGEPAVSQRVVRCV